MQANKKTLLRWSALFIVGNIILFWILSLPSFLSNPWLQAISLPLQNKFIIHLFMISAYLGQMGLLALLMSLLILPLIVIIPKPRIIFPLCISVATFIAFVLFVDVFTYKIYRFHLNGTILDLAVNGLSEQVWEISPIECFILSAIVIALFVIESVICLAAWRFFITKPLYTRTLKSGVILATVSSLLLSYAIFIASSGSTLNRILNTMANTLPMYTEFFEVIMPSRINQLTLNKLPGNFLNKSNQTTLNYPLKKVQCDIKNNPKNLLIIVIDTWRYDMLNSINSPNLMAFANKSWVFTHHFSGGNATAPGIFSLFYSLPASYWTLMKDQHHGPILIDELIKQHYQMAIFSSATLHLPPFDQTVFSAIHNLRMGSKGATPYDRDQAVTQDFQQFLTKQRDPSRPFFSFLFYDAVHSYCSFTEDLKPLPAIQNCNHMDMTNNTDPTLYFNRYKNALTLVDQQIKQVYQTLETKHLLDDTVVLITGDHGEEFNDNHQGFWGHASNFTRAQVQTPLIVYWPGKTHKTFTHATSHFDIVPTLMNELLECHSSVASYSLGKSLFDTSIRPYLIAGSYTGYAVIEPKQTSYISLGGKLNTQHSDSAPYPEVAMDKDTLHAVFQDVQKFLITH